MKLRMRHERRRSKEEIDASFDPINLDYIFEEDDPLSPWIEERENPLLDGQQSSEWLPRVDTDDEEVEDRGSNEGSGGGLSPPSGNSGNSGGGAEVEENDNEDDEQRQSYQEPSYNRRDNNLLIDIPISRSDMIPSDGSLGDGRRGTSQSRRGRRLQNVALEDSSSFNVAQSFSDFSIGESSQSSQGYYPPYYQHPHFSAYIQYVSGQVLPYHQSSMSYQEPYYQKSSGGVFYYIFEQGAT